MDFKERKQRRKNTCPPFSSSTPLRWSKQGVPPENVSNQNNENHDPAGRPCTCWVLLLQPYKNKGELCNLSLRFAEINFVYIRTKINHIMEVN